MTDEMVWKEIAEGLGEAEELIRVMSLRPVFGNTRNATIVLPWSLKKENS